MEHENFNNGYVDLVQSVGGTWYAYLEGENISGPFRRASDAQEWANREGYIVDSIQAWSGDK